MESEHDQLVRMREQARIFRAQLEVAITLSIGEYKEVREQILGWFDACFADKENREPTK